MLSLSRVLRVLVLIQLALSAPANPPSNFRDTLILGTSSLGSNHSLIEPLPIGNLSGASNGNCASSNKYHSWKTPNWDIEDCYSAVHQMFLREVFTHPDEPFEFVAKGASATKLGLNPQRTPRKYVVRKCYICSLKSDLGLGLTSKGTCVLTIMTLESFYPGELPNGRIFPPVKTDISTYRKIYTAAKGVETQCTEIRTPGWAILGK